MYTNYPILPYHVLGMKEISNDIASSTAETVKDCYVPVTIDGTEYPNETILFNIEMASAPANSNVAYAMSDYYLNLGKAMEIYEQESNRIPEGDKYIPRGIVIDEDQVRNNIKRLLSEVDLDTIEEYYGEDYESEFDSSDFDD